MFPIRPRIASDADLSLLIGPIEFLLSEIELQPATDLVLVSGSLVEGFGNATSDIDLLVLANSAVTRRNRVYRSRAFGRWVDVTYHSVESILSSLAVMPSFQPKFSSWGVPDPAPLAVVELAHDVLRGIAITSPWQAPARLPDATFRLMRTWAVTNIISARARWLDAIGAYLDGHSAQATFLLSMCAGHCVDAYTSLLDETDINVKWRWAKLARAQRDGRDILDLSIQALASLDVSDSAKAIENKFQEVGSFLFDVMCLFYDGTLREPSVVLKSLDRVEIYGGRWTKVGPDGLSYEIPEPSIRRFTKISPSELSHQG